jgi:hypothetical protein
MTKKGGQERRAKKELLSEQKEFLVQVGKAVSFISTASTIGCREVVM